MTDHDRALAAAMAQIDEAFGKDAKRERIKVWMDPFTEDHVYRWVRERVDGWLPDDFDMRDMMWESISDDMADGEHRVLDGHPFDRMYPPVTLGERIGLFFRRLFGRWQRSQAQKWDAEIARMAPPPRPAQPLATAPGEPPF